MDRMSNLLQLANFPIMHGGPQMPPWQQGMFPPAFGNPGSTGAQFSGSQQFGGAPPGIGMGGQFGGDQLGGGLGGPMRPPQFPWGNGGYGNGGYDGMNNLMMMHQLGRGNGSGYGGY